MMYYFWMSVGARIKMARKVAGISQVELAKRSRMSQQMISALESGRRANTFGLVRVAEVLGVSYRWLAEGKLPMLDSGSLAGATQDEIIQAFHTLPVREQVRLLAELLRATAEQFLDEEK